MTTVWRLRVVGSPVWVADLNVHGLTFADEQSDAKEFTDHAAARRAAARINRQLDTPPVRVSEGEVSQRPETASAAH